MPDTKKIHTYIRRAPALIWGFFVFYFSLLPSDRIPKTLLEFSDLLLHFLIYSFWMVLSLWARPFPTRPPLRRTILVGVILISLSLLIEIIQGVFIPGRTFSLLDLLANGTGILIGGTIARYLRF
ncbi:MAG: VanZ family protein [Bacteroidota bacterium]|nr:VanZ family protein [Bacteroidota bacterium]